MTNSFGNNKGYYVVAAAWLGAFCLFGFRSTFAVLKDPISEAMLWTQAQVTLGYSLMMVCYALTAFFCGFIIDKWGTRPAYLIAAFAGGISFVLSSQATSLAMFYLSFGLFGGISTGMLWITSIVSVRKWFVGGSYASMWGLAFAGAPMSQLLLSYVTRWIMADGADADSWRVAMLVLGTIVFCLLILAALLSKNSPEHYGLSPVGQVPETEESNSKSWTFKSAYSTWPIWSAILVFLSSMTGEFLIWTQVVSFWTSDLGWGIDEAVGAYAMIGLAGIFAMPIVGLGSDKVVNSSKTETSGRRRVLIIGPMIGLAACGLLFLSSFSFVFAYFSAVCFAFYWAAIPGGVVGYVGSVYGREALGKIWGFATLIVMGAGPFIGSYMGALLRDISGDYTYSIIFAACAFMLSLTVAFFLPIRLK